MYVFVLKAVFRGGGTAVLLQIRGAGVGIWCIIVYLPTNTYSYINIYLYKQNSLT